MVKERRLGVLLVGLLAAVLAALPVAALASPPDGVPPGCDRDNGGPGGGNGNDPCLPTTTTTLPSTTTTTAPADTTTTTHPQGTTTTTHPQGTTTTTLPSTTTTTTPADTTTTTHPQGTTTTTTDPGATTTTTTTQPGATTTTQPGVTTTTQPGVTTTTTGAGGTTGRPSDPGSSGATVTLPAPVGLHAVDTGDMSSSMAGAVMIVAKSGDTATEPTDMPEAPGGLSVSINRLLGPVAPPALVDAVASPLVVIEALVAAMTSSSQALIIPGIVLLVGFGIPGRRRNGDRRHRALTFSVPSS